MKKFLALLFLLLILSVCCSCTGLLPEPDELCATQYGVLPGNTGEENSKALQALVDRAALSRKTIYIPAGEYEFAENGRQTIGSHCIKMRSGVSIRGDGEKTVLCPVGQTRYGLDMFYFNEYLDTGEAVYLEDCRFQDFVIDARDTACEVYTSAGKGFMFNLFRNCHFQGITVKNTDATGFGVDCPINSTITACTAIGCGKAAGADSTGAAGFGIGFGYCEEEDILISDCTAVGNKRFGFFFEHQGRFRQESYHAVPSAGFRVERCTATENLYGFGGINALCTDYVECTSARSLRYGFYFEDSFDCDVRCAKSREEGEACFAVLQRALPAGAPAWTGEILFSDCEGEDAPLGLLVMGVEGGMPQPALAACCFTGVTDETSYLTFA